MNASGRRKLLWGVSALTLLLALGVLSAAAWLVLVYPRTLVTSQDTDVVVQMDPALSLDEVASLLGDKGVLERPRLWARYLRLLDRPTRPRALAVRFVGAMQPIDVARHAFEGYGHINIWVTIPEGFTRFQIAERLERAGVCDGAAFLKATEDAALLGGLGLSGSAEGYLFPDTYEFVDRSDPRALVKRMVETWQRRVDALFASKPAMRTSFDELKLSMAEVVNLASIVEQEAALPGERARIAGVFYNRLQSKTFLPSRRLQADPTVAYGCMVEPARAPSCAAFSGVITSAMLKDANNRYNTYVHAGLPPGPICNPGLAALRAVLERERHRYLYFVARGDGGHTFSETLADHNRAVQQYRRSRP